MRFRPTIAATTLAVGLLIAAPACGSSSDGAGSATTAGPTTTSTTTAEASTTAAVEAAVTTTTEASTVEGLPSCQDVLQQYADAFTPDDLAPVVAKFRAWAPLMPDDVAAAVTRIADAYEAAGSLGKLDLADQDLTADAQTFTDWTNEGCPPG